MTQNTRPRVSSFPLSAPGRVFDRLPVGPRASAPALLGLALAAAAALLAGACGDDAGAANPDAAPGAADARPADAAPVDAAPDAVPPGPPSVTVHFPPSLAATVADTVIVRGVATPGAGSPGVVAVRVGGVSAQSDDDFATWSAEVAVSAGRQDLTVEVENAGGDTAQATVTLFGHRGFQSVQGLTLIPAADPANDPARLLLVVTDGDAQSALWSQPAPGGPAQVVSAPDVGAGPLGGGAWRTVAVDVGRDRALVLAVEGILAIDLDAGTRTLLSPNLVTHGPVLVLPRDLVIDPAGDRLLIADAGLEAVVAVNLADGQRSLLGAATPPDADPFVATVRAIALDSAGGRLLLLADDRTEGNDIVQQLRTVALADGARDALGELRNALDLVVTGTDELVLSAGLGAAPALLRHDLGTGAEVTLSQDPCLLGPSLLALDPDRGEVLVYDQRAQAVDAVALADRARARRFGVFLGQGPCQARARGVTVSADGKRAFFVGPDRQAGPDRLSVIEADLATGQRSQGPDLAGAPLRTLVHDPDRDRLLGIADPGAGSDLVSVPVGAGDLVAPLAAITDARALAPAPNAAPSRLLVSRRDIDALFGVALAEANPSAAELVPTGVGLPAGAGALAANDAGTRALVGAGDGLFLLDLGGAQAAPERLAGAGVGSGIALDAVHAVAFDQPRGRAVVLATVSEVFTTTALVAVDLADQSRSVLMSDQVGRGGGRFGPSPFLRVDGPRAVAWVADRGDVPGLYAIDLLSGDRVLVHR
ncbi:hypothetical protein [Haliangium sp.]|uniref:hypothetical protein n=1 Tax=Haliangium sp. TaxID=2663208 RepID=UPI003D145E7A